MHQFLLENIAEISHGESQKIHFIGICGSAMGQIALEFDSHGHQVSGSDDEFYDPMASALKQSGIKLYKGYSPENISPETDVVVIGNSIRRDNPELEAIANHSLPYTCMPAIVSDALVRNRKALVVSGTHGKSTTSALLAHVLESCNKQPGYLVGAKVPTLEGSFRFGKGEYSVLEGDEYDSVFFAKVPKFTFYDPYVLVITSIEFDHADIYSDLESIVSEFNKLVESRPSGSTVFCCIDNENIRSLLAVWKQNSKAEIKTYGTSEDADWRLESIEYLDNVTRVKVSAPEDRQIAFSLPLIGLHNALNATSVLAVSDCLKLPESDVLDSFGSFQGVARRLNLIAEKDQKKIFEDFAHHPTAVKATLEALRSSTKASRLVAVFEPRSNTSRRGLFQQDYQDALALADCSIIKSVTPRKGDESAQLLNTDLLAESLREHGKVAVAVQENEEILDFLEHKLLAGDVVVLMSNGSFGGLLESVKTLFS